MNTLNRIEKVDRHTLIQDMVDIHNWHLQQATVRGTNKKKALHQKYAGQLFKAVQILKQTLEEQPNETQIRKLEV